MIAKRKKELAKSCKNFKRVVEKEYCNRVGTFIGCQALEVCQLNIKGCWWPNPFSGNFVELKSIDFSTKLLFESKFKALDKRTKYLTLNHYFI